MWTVKINFDGNIPMLASMTEDFFDDSMFECYRERVTFPKHRMSYAFVRKFKSMGIEYEHKFRITGIEKFGGASVCTLRLESEQQYNFYREMFESYESLLSGYKEAMTPLADNNP